MDMLSILSVIVKANGMDLSVRDGQIVASWPGANRVGEGRENTACDRNKTSQIVLYIYRHPKAQYRLDLRIQMVR